jgi:hypothetical protein
MGEGNSSGRNGLLVVKIIGARAFELAPLAATLGTISTTQLTRNGALCGPDAHPVNHLRQANSRSVVATGHDDRIRPVGTERRKLEGHRNRRLASMRSP